MFRNAAMISSSASRRSGDARHSLRASVWSASASWRSMSVRDFIVPPPSHSPPARRRRWRGGSARRRPFPGAPIPRGCAGPGERRDGSAFRGRASFGPLEGSPLDVEDHRLVVDLLRVEKVIEALQIGDLIAGSLLGAKSGDLFRAARGPLLANRKRLVALFDD